MEEEPLTIFAEVVVTVVSLDELNILTGLLIKVVVGFGVILLNACCEAIEGCSEVWSVTVWVLCVLDCVKTNLDDEDGVRDECVVKLLDMGNEISTLFETFDSFCTRKFNEWRVKEEGETEEGEMLANEEIYDNDECGYTWLTLGDVEMTEVRVWGRGNVDVNDWSCTEKDDNICEFSNVCVDIDEDLVGVCNKGDKSDEGIIFVLSSREGFPNKADDDWNIWLDEWVEMRVGTSLVVCKIENEETFCLAIKVDV